MAGNSIHINPSNNTVVVQEGQTQILEVKALGPQGRIGPPGPPGPSGSMSTVGPTGSIQFAWINGAASGSKDFSFTPSTSTLRLSGSFFLSGSILPDINPVTGISSFSLGSADRPWKDLYVSSNSIYFVSASVPYALTLTSSDAGQTTLSIDGNRVALTNVAGLQNISASYALTASYALNTFSNLIYTGSVTASLNITDDILTLASASENMFRVNKEGVLVLRENIAAPTPVAGGIYYSGSGEFFFGF